MTALRQTYNTAIDHTIESLRADEAELLNQHLCLGDVDDYETRQVRRLFMNAYQAFVNLIEHQRESWNAIHDEDKEDPT